MSGTARAQGEEGAALRVVHDIPGRLRLRLPPAARTVELAEAVAALPGVTACAWSSRTRSLLVRYRVETTTPEDITAHVGRQAEVDAVLGADVPAPVNGRPTVAAAIVEALSEVDRGVHRASRGLFGLGTLLPVGLTVWALAEVLRGRTAPLAWSTALWYAHGLFRDYNTPGGSSG